MATRKLANEALPLLVDEITGALQVAGGTTSRISVLYNGGGTANALGVNKTTSTPVSGAATIDVGSNNFLEVFVVNTTAAETITLSIAEYSAATPSKATLIREISVPLGSDLARTVDSACVALVTGTEMYAKTPVRIKVTPGSYVNLCVIENITGPAYARYQLGGSV